MKKVSVLGGLGWTGPRGLRELLPPRAQTLGSLSEALLPRQWQRLHFARTQQNRPPAPPSNYPLMASSFAFFFSALLCIFLSFQRVLENDENVEEGNEEEDLEEDIPKRKNRTRGRVSRGRHEGGRVKGG